MAEQKRPDDDRRGTIPFVNDAADAPDQGAPVDANAERAIAAEEELKRTRPDAGTIPLPKEGDEGSPMGVVKPQND